jgi:hypothetical protein
MKLDVRPHISPKPIPRAFQSSHTKPKLENTQESGKISNENLSLVHVQMSESNGHTNGTNGENNLRDDEVDEGLAALRRQPSIRDRKKVTLRSDNLYYQQMLRDFRHSFKKLDALAYLCMLFM